VNFEFEEDSLEETPWDTTEQISNKKHLDVDGEEQNENSAS